MKILLINLNHIGDLIFTLPAVDLLRQRLPEAELIHLVSRSTLPLVQHDPRFAQNIPRPLRGWSEWIRIVRDLRREHRFDAALNFCRTSAGLGLVTRLSGANLRIGFAGARETHLFFTHRIPYNDDLHRVERNADLLRPLGIEPGMPPPMRLHLPERLSEKMKDRLASGSEGAFRLPGSDLKVALCLGASTERKRWPLSRHIALAKRLHAETGCRFVLVGGKEDEADAAQFREETDLPTLSFCGSVGLMESAALLRHCDLAIGGDTGPLQIAIAVETPIIALFGPTEPRRTGPYRAQGETLFHRQSCCGCRSAVPCPIDYRCMREITVEEVTEAALRVLQPSRSLSTAFIPLHAVGPSKSR